MPGCLDLTLKYKNGYSDLTQTWVGFKGPGHAYVKYMGKKKIVFLCFGQVKMFVITQTKLIPSEEVFLHIP